MFWNKDLSPYTLRNYYVANYICSLNINNTSSHNASYSIIYYMYLQWIHITPNILHASTFWICNLKSEDISNELYTFPYQIKMIKHTKTVFLLTISQMTKAITEPSIREHCKEDDKVLLKSDNSEETKLITTRRSCVVCHIHTVPP